MNDARAFQRSIALLAFAWAAVGLAVTIGLARAGLAGEPMGIATIAGAALGLIGLIGCLRFQLWGVLLYLAANLLLIVKPWLFGAGATAGGAGWGYWFLLALFLALVASNWNRFRGRNA